MSKDPRRTKKTKSSPASYQKSCEDVSHIFVEASEAVMNALINPEKLSRKDIARFTLIMISSYGFVMPRLVELFTKALNKDSQAP